MDRMGWKNRCPETTMRSMRVFLLSLLSVILAVSCATPQTKPATRRFQYKRAHPKIVAAIGYVLWTNKQSVKS